MRNLNEALAEPQVQARGIVAALPLGEGGPTAHVPTLGFRPTARSSARGSRRARRGPIPGPSWPAWAARQPKSTRCWPTAS
ncbi:MAG: hypothetical protein R3E68_11865 [Burkholderiaceae bacterium]